MKGGAKVVVEKHRHEGIFVARGKEDALLTRVALHSHRLTLVHPSSGQDVTFEAPLHADMAAVLAAYGLAGVLL